MLSILERVIKLRGLRVDCSMGKVGHSPVVGKRGFQYVAHSKTPLLLLSLELPQTASWQSVQDRPVHMEHLVDALREFTFGKNLYVVSEIPFLALPESILRSLRDEWLHIKDVVRLDSAWCSSQSRRSFIALVYEKSKIYSVPTEKTGQHARVWYKRFLHWVVAREAHIDNLTVNNDILRDNELHMELLSINCECLTTLHFYAYNVMGRSCCKLFTEIVRLCPQVMHVHIDVLTKADQGGYMDNCLDVLTRGFQRLTTLTIGACPATASGIATALSHCKYLKHLTISSNLTVNAGIAIPSLTYLDCRSAHVEAGVLIAVGQRCHGLRSLYMTWEHLRRGTVVHVTEVGVCAVLQGCPSLRETDLFKFGGVSNGLRAELARRCSLTELRFSQWDNVNEALAQEVLVVCPKLTVFSCSGEWLTDATLAVCAQHCPLLQEVAIPGCPNVTNNGVGTLVRRMGSQLRRIHFEECELDEGRVFSAVAENCPGLTHIDDRLDVSDAVLVKLAQGCPQLMKLDMTDSSITDVGMAALAAHCVKLEDLAVNRCGHVTMKGVRAVAERCRCLKVLIVPTHVNCEEVKRLVVNTCSVSSW
jgi:hypothetical protein